MGARTSLCSSCHTKKSKRPLHPWPLGDGWAHAGEDTTAGGREQARALGSRTVERCRGEQERRQERAVPEMPRASGRPANKDCKALDTAIGGGW